MSQQLSHLCTKFAFPIISTIEFTSNSIWCQRWDLPHVCCHRWSDNRSPENRFHPAIYFCWIFQLNMIALYWTLLMWPFSNRFADIFPGLGISNNFCRHPPHICHLWYATTALPRDKTALAHLAFGLCTWCVLAGLLGVLFGVFDVFGICCCFKWCFLSCPKWCPNIVHVAPKWCQVASFMLPCGQKMCWFDLISGWLLDLLTELIKLILLWAGSSKTCIVPNLNISHMMVTHHRGKCWEFFR